MRPEKNLGGVAGSNSHEILRILVFSFQFLKITNIFLKNKQTGLAYLLSSFSRKYFRRVSFV
jgi:hypothetical protein